MLFNYTNYWFHLHTNYTDGSLSIQEYFKLAGDVDLLIFLEHIRQNPKYDVTQFVNEVHACSKRFQKPAKIGFEAKILPEGHLDISEEHLEKADMIGIAEHSFPSDLSLFLTAWEKVFQKMSHVAKKKPVIWVHPGLFLKKQGLMESKQELYQELLKRASDLGILLEHNLKYQLLEKKLCSFFPYIIGIDMHHKEDVERIKSTICTA